MVAGAGALAQRLGSSHRCVHPASSALDGGRGTAAAAACVRAPTAAGRRGCALLQVLHISNSAHGSKALAMRLRVTWSAGGQAVQHMGEVTGFPPGL